jgi:hypothetical protein
VDSSFNFLSSEQVHCLNEILARRNPALAERLRRSELVSRGDAEEVVSTLGTELINNLDDEWEPADYGRAVSRLLDKVNAARIKAWPE